MMDQCTFISKITEQKTQSHLGVRLSAPLRLRGVRGLEASEAFDASGSAGCLLWGIFEQKIGISNTKAFSYATLTVTMAPLR